MRFLGGNLTQAQLKAIVAEAPFNFLWFLDLIVKYMKPETFNCQLRDAFEELRLLSSTKLEKDNTGFVSVTELHHILTNTGEKLEPTEFDEWITKVDVGSNPFLLTPI